MSTPRPLIVRLCNMVGDTVLSIPALKLLEAHGYELHLYGKGWAAGLLAGHGWHCVARAGSLRERIAQLRKLRRLCQAKDPTFDQRANTLVMPNSFSSAFEARWAGLRPAGYARDGRSLLLSRRENPQHGPHALEGFWQLACSFLGITQSPPERIDMAVAPNDQAEADALLATRGIAPGFICVVPFAAGVVDKMDKKWPHFAQLCQALRASGHTLVACPGPGETDLEQPGFEQVIALPDVKLGTYLGILRRAALVISNDTGPAHMAAAVGAPTLSVLGPTKPEQWRPWGPTVHMIKQWPQWPASDTVAQAARDILSGSSRTASPWLSIVMPAYNVQPYLQACLQSIATQWAEGIEVIMVEDCSTDGSAAELMRLQKEVLPQMRIIQHAQNQGLSAARNTGLDAARGDYVWFLDSDDWLNPGVIARLHAIVQQHAPDLILCDFQMHRDQMKLKHKWRGELHRSTFTGPTGALSHDKGLLLGGVFAAGQLHTWSKIARRNLWGQDLRFPLGRYFEDAFTTPSLLSRAHSFFHVNEPWVVYRQREGSILNKMDLRKIDDMSAAFDAWRLDTRGFAPSSAAYARFGVAWHLTRTFIGACKHLARAQPGDDVRQALRLSRQRYLANSPLTPGQLSVAFLQRGWFWRAMRLWYWLKRADQA